MKISKTPPPLKAERKKTDQSLIAERDKTDESLVGAIGNAENRTDTLVKKSRTESDQTTSSSRKEADAIEGARSRVDAAIDQERTLKNALVSDLLEGEREQTDEDLGAERSQTDLMVSHASNRLSDEVAQHSKTKVTLTTRDEFLAIVSHDLKNPIGTISSCAHLLLDDAALRKLGSEKVIHWIEVIERNAGAALRLIEDLLDMERVAEGKLHLKMESCSIDEIIRDSIESFVQVAAGKDVNLRALPSKVSTQAICDRDRIMQVLANLIGNALKFTSAGGSVVLSKNLTEAEVKVSVSDTGPGIPEERKGRIFERFAQLGSKDRRGLGLGLYISKMLIEAHKGRLWVQSKVGKGSTFYFVIPKAGVPASMAMLAPNIN